MLIGLTLATAKHGIFLVPFRCIFGIPLAAIDSSGGMFIRSVSILVGLICIMFIIWGIKNRSTLFGRFISICGVCLWYIASFYLT